MLVRARLARPSPEAAYFVKRLNTFRSKQVSWTPLRHSILMLALVLIGGVIGYMAIEGWSMWDSVFFTVVTITTVGYGDGGLSDRGEQFTLLIMLVGIGTLTYTIGQTMSVIIKYQFDKERAMNSEIMKLEDHVIVCGLGRIGTAVAQELDSHGVPFVGIESEPEKVEQARACGWLVLQGCATDEKLLLRARPDTARAVAVLTDKDTENIVATMTVRQLMPELEIIARIESRSSEPKMRIAGATTVFMPSELGGRIVTDALLLPRDTDQLRAASFRLVYARLCAGSPLADKPLGSWLEAHPKISIVAAIARDGRKNIRPSDSVVLEPGDTVVLAGDSAQIEVARMEIATQATC